MPRNLHVTKRRQITQSCGLPCSFRRRTGVGMAQAWTDLTRSFAATALRRVSPHLGGAYEHILSKTASCSSHTGIPGQPTTQKSERTTRKHVCSKLASGVPLHKGQRLEKERPASRKGFTQRERLHAMSTSFYRRPALYLSRYSSFNTQDDQRQRLRGITCILANLNCRGRNQEPLNGPSSALLSAPPTPGMRN